MTTLESENSGTPRPETAQPNGRRKPARKAKAPKKAPRAKKAAAKAKADGSNKKSEVLTLDEASQGRNVGRDHKGHGLAGAYSTRLRQHPRQERRREYRIVQERGRRPDIQDRQVVRTAVPLYQTPLPVPAQRRFPTCCRSQCSSSDVTDL